MKIVYRISPKKMTTKERINEVFQRFNIGLKATDEVVTEETKLEAQAVLDNGTIIHTDADSFEEGADVFIINEEGEHIPLPEGDYTLQDGAVLVVLEGGKLGKPASKGDGKEGAEGKPVAEGQAPKGKAPDKKAAPEAPAKKAPAKGKKSEDAKLAEDEDVKEEEKDEVEVEAESDMNEEAVIALINKVLDERFPVEEEEMSTEDTTELEVEFEVELSEIELLKEQLSKQEAELTELKSEAASEGIRRAATTEAKAVTVDLSSLSTDERIKALFNQYNA